MHEYYFKIKKESLEFEFSTTDKATFEEKLADWVNNIMKTEKTIQTQQVELENDFQDNQNSQRNDFIDIQSHSSINEIQTQDFSMYGEQKNDIDLSNAQEISFEEALNESMQNPKTEVIEKQDPKSDFEEFANTYNPESQMDYLIISASYIQNQENQERFSIKQLNSKIVPLTGNAIDHAMIQEAIEQNYIRIIPDLTGTSELTEYSLTEEGESYFIV